MFLTIGTRRGFTVVELVVAATMLVAVGAVTYGLLLSTQRVSRHQVEQVNLQDNVRAGVTLLPAELREIGYDSSHLTHLVTSDLLEIAADRIRFRAMRGVGITCAIAATELRVRRPVFGYRQPAMNDDILLFVEHNADLADDDEWTPLGVGAVNTVSTCGPDPAVALTLDGAGLPAGLLDAVVVGAPVRFYEVMEMGLYGANGRSWLGARSISAGEATAQPVLGPLADGDGLAFRYFDAAGAEVAVTGDRAAIRTIEITVRGRSDAAVAVGGSGRPQVIGLNLVTRVALRNALRP